MAVPAVCTPATGPMRHLYGAAGTPCVAAHSTTRAPYQIKRQTDGKPLDIGLNAGGYADAAAQDGFCAKSICIINLIYDQSGKGPAKGAFDTADRGHGANYNRRPQGIRRLDPLPLNA